MRPVRPLQAAHRAVRTRIQATCSATLPSASSSAQTRTYTSTTPVPTFDHLPVPPKPPTFGQPLAATHAHLLKDRELTPGITAGEYAERRRKLMESLPLGSVVVCMGSTVRLISQQIFFKFRQSTDFYYLTGFDEPDATVVLVSRPSTPSGYTYTLFVPPRNRHELLWSGERNGVDGAIEIFGADEAYSNAELSAMLPSYLQSASTVYAELPPSPSPSPYSQPFTPPAPRRRSSLLKLFSPAESKTASVNPFVHGDPPHLMLAAALASDKAEPLERPIQQLRVRKSPAELKLMKTAADISAAAHTSTMRFAAPGRTEAVLAAHFEYQCALAGSERPAYVPVVASGGNSLVIHYTRNDCTLGGDEMVLIDAGAERHMYASDITRTFPVSGKFTPEQKDLYQAVLNVQKECVRLCRVEDNVNMNELHRKSCTLLGEELRNIGFKVSTFDVERKLYPHFLGHHVGSDLHDCPTVDRSSVLVAGNVITIEPGLYVPPDASFPKAFHGLGVRIEDEVALTKDGPWVLSANAPKEVVDVEGACQGVLE